MSEAKWGLWRLPCDLAPGELKWVRVSLALPRNWRGFLAEFDTHDEARSAWDSEPDKAELFIREIDEALLPARAARAVLAGEDTP